MTFYIDLNSCYLSIYWPYLPVYLLLTYLPFDHVYAHADWHVDGACDLGLLRALLLLPPHCCPANQTRSARGERGPSANQLDGQLLRHSLQGLQVKGRRKRGAIKAYVLAVYVCMLPLMLVLYIEYCTAILHAWCLYVIADAQKEADRQDWCRWCINVSCLGTVSHLK